MITKREQNLARRLDRLSTIVDQLQLANSRPPAGSNVRLAKVVTSSTHPTTGQVFEIEFQNGTFATSGGSTPTYTVRKSTKAFCCNVINYLPALNDYIIVWFDNERWWTKCEDPNPA